MATASNPVQSVASETRVGIQWSSNDRSTSDIFQSCLFTIILSTWTVLHLNIPAPSDTLWILFKRRLKWMVVTIIAPEFTCSIALRQWVQSRITLKQMRKYDKSWTISHSFYAAMGGYVLHHQNLVIPLTVPEILCLLETTAADESASFKLPSLSESEIEDRSKLGDISKLITAAQIAWLVLQFIVRTLNGLPVAPIEIATVAFAVCTIFAHCFWWNKPVDLRIATPVEYHGDLHGCASFMSKGWRSRQTAQRIKLTAQVVERGSQRSMFFNLFLPFFIFGILFSSLHLLSWNFQFATLYETRLWQSCALIATFTPLAISGFLQLASIWDPTVPERSRKIASCPELAAVVVIAYFLSVLAYVAARVALLFETFFSFRSMPAGLYQTIPWTKYFPHV